MGLSLDWSRELATCHPGYYQYQQDLFLDFFKAGLAYRGEAAVNWIRWTTPCSPTSR